MAATWPLMPGFSCSRRHACQHRVHRLGGVGWGDGVPRELWAAGAAAGGGKPAYVHTPVCLKAVEVVRAALSLYNIALFATGGWAGV